LNMQDIADRLEHWCTHGLQIGVVVNRKETPAPDGCECRYVDSCQRRVSINQEEVSGGREHKYVTSRKGVVVGNIEGSADRRERGKAKACYGVVNSEFDKATDGRKYRDCHA